MGDFTSTKQAKARVGRLGFCNCSRGDGSANRECVPYRRGLKTIEGFPAHALGTATRGRGSSQPSGPPLDDDLHGGGDSARDALHFGDIRHVHKARSERNIGPAAGRKPAPIEALVDLGEPCWTPWAILRSRASVTACAQCVPGRELPSSFLMNRPTARARPTSPLPRPSCDTAVSSTAPTCPQISRQKRVPHRDVITAAESPRFFMRRSGATEHAPREPYRRRRSGR